MQLICEISSSAKAVRGSVVSTLNSAVLKLNRKRTTVCLGPVFLIPLMWSASAQTTTYSATTESQELTWNRSTRVKQTRTEANGRTIETQIVEEPSINGGYILKTAREKETIHDTSNIVHVVERWYIPDGDGQRRLSRISESKTATAPGANTTTIRTTYESDLDGHLREVAHEMEQSTPLNASANQTVSTLFVRREGVFAPVQQGVTYEPVQQAVTVETRKENGIVEVQRTISVPDSTGKLIPKLVTNSVEKQAGAGTPTSKEEEVLGADAGKVLGEGQTMSPIQRTVTQEWKDQDGQEHSLANTYSMFPAGVAPDGKLHLNRQVATVRQVMANGDTQVVQEIAVTPAATTDRPQPSQKIIEISRRGSSGQFETWTTIQEPNASGAMQPFGVSNARGFRSGNH